MKCFGEGFLACVLKSSGRGDVLGEFDKEWGAALFGGEFIQEDCGAGDEVFVPSKFGVFFIQFFLIVPCDKRGCVFSCDCGVGRVIAGADKESHWIRCCFVHKDVPYASFRGCTDKDMTWWRVCIGGVVYGVGMGYHEAYW